MIGNNRKKGAFNFATSLLYKIVTIVIGLILPKLFITTYGSEINGLQSSVGQIFSYISLIEGGIGAATLQSLYAPVAKNDRNKINAYLSATSSYYNRIGIIYFCILLIIGIGYAVLIPVNGYSIWFVFLYILVSGALTGVNFFYLGKLKLLMGAKGDDYLITILTMCTFIGTSVLKIVLISQGVNIVILQSGYLAVNLIITFVYFLIARRKYPWLSFHEIPDSSCVEQKNSVLIHRISSMIFQNIDIVLLTFLCGLNVVSIYTIYKMVTSTITTIVSTMGDSINFIFGQKFNSENDERKPAYCKIIDTFNVYYSAISFALFSVMCSLIIPFMKLYTAEMDQSYIYYALPYLFITIELLTVGREAMLRTIEVAGHFKKTQWRAVLESAINLSVSVIAIIVCKVIYGNVGGLYGALIGTVIAMLYRTIDINIYANKQILHRSCKKSFWIIIVNLFTMTISLSVVKPLVVEYKTYASFFINAIWITLIVLLVSIVLQSLCNMKEAKNLLKILKGIRMGNKNIARTNLDH